MYGSELTRLINATPFLEAHFSGIYTLQDLPSHIYEKQFIIINTCSVFGKHWLAFLRIDPYNYEFFDSNGTTKSFCDTHFKFLKGNLEFNMQRTQPLDSGLCGEFCLFYSYHRICNLDLDYENFFSLYFSHNLNKNDSAVKGLVQKLQKNVQ